MWPALSVSASSPTRMEMIGVSPPSTISPSCSAPRVSRSRLSRKRALSTSYSPEVRMSQTVQIASRYAGATGPQDVRVRLHFQEFLELRRAANEATQARKRLGQRADHEGDVVIAQRVQHGAAAVSAQYAG